MDKEKFADLVLRYGKGQFVEPFSELERTSLELARRNNLDYLQMSQVLEEVKRKLVEKSTTQQPF